MTQIHIRRQRLHGAVGDGDLVQARILRHAVPCAHRAGTHTGTHIYDFTHMARRSLVTSPAASGEAP